MPGAYPGTAPGTFPVVPGENPATTPVLPIPPPALGLEIRLDCGSPFASGCVSAHTRVSLARRITFTCRPRIVQGARYLRISSGALGSASIAGFQAKHTKTVRLVGGRATLRLRLDRAEARRVRRAGQAGKRVLIRARALDAAREPLRMQTMQTRLKSR